MKSDGWKAATARKQGYRVQVLFVDVCTRRQFWSTKAAYSTKREAFADADKRTAESRVVDFEDRIVKKST